MPPAYYADLRERLAASPLEVKEDLDTIQVRGGVNLSRRGGVKLSRRGGVKLSRRGGVKLSRNT